jgi:flagellar hook-associated protein 3 FlgL
MGVTSVNIMRVSGNLQTMSLLESLRRNTLNLFLEQNRIGSGNKFTAPSQDPVNSAKAINLTEILEQQDQLVANIQHADGFLSATDSGIGEINDLLTQAYSISSEMVNSTADQSQRQSMAELVKGIINQLVSVGNRTYEGVQLFGGQQTTEPPFTQVTGGVEYRGDAADLTTRVDYRQNPAFNLSGAELFGMLSSQVTGSVDLNPAITEDTRLIDLGGAAQVGVTPGQIRIALTSPATSFTVDLSQAATVGDVVDVINAAASAAGLSVGPGGDFNAAVNPGGAGISLGIGAGAVTVGEVGNGVTARDLGLLATNATGVNGGDLNARVTTTTPISSLFAGGGASLGSIVVQNGEASATLDLSGAATVGDILNAINGCGMNVEARINSSGSGIDIINRVSGSRMSIGESGGNTAGLLGIRSMYGGTALSSLNDGLGVTNKPGQTDFRIITRDGSTVDVSISGAKTIGDVLTAINTAAAAAGVNVTASLAQSGNGIQIADATAGAGTLHVERLNGSSAADDLGILKSDAAGTGTIIGNDVANVRTDSVFTALYDLYDALTATNPSHITEQQITRAGETIQRFIGRSTQLRGTVGARSQAMTTRLNMTQDAVTATRAMLSEVKDLDYTEAITKFQQAQTALQGNLMTGSRLFQLSLMNYL